MPFPEEWLYHIPLFVDNSGGSEDLFNFPLELKLDASNFDFTKANSDGSDIRFTDTDKTTLLPYWIESWNSANQTAVIWVKIPFIPGSGIKVIYMYYGNGSAASASSGDDVFLFFDDFDTGDLSSDKWITSGYSGYSGINYSISDGKLDVWGNNAWQILKMNKTFTPDDRIIVETLAFPPQRSYWHASMLVEDSNANHNRFGIQDDNSGTWRIQYVVQNNYYFPKTLQDPLDYGHWFLLRLIKESNTTMKAEVYEADEFVSSYETTQTAWSTTAWTWVTWKHDTTHSTYEWIRVRPYVDPMPVLSLQFPDSSVSVTFSQKNHIYDVEKDITGVDKVLMFNLGKPLLVDPEQTHYYYVQRLANPIVYIPFSNSVRNFTSINVQTDSAHIDFIPDKDGRLTEAANFFGEAGQFVSVSTTFSLGSLVFWFFTTRSNVDVCQMYANDTVVNSLFVDSAGNFVVNGTVTMKVNDGQWHCVSLTTTKCFIDGVDAGDMSIVSVFDKVIFGPDNGHGAFIGHIDEFRFYSNEVNLLEAKVLYSNLKMNWQPPEIKIIEEKPGNIDYPSAEVTNLFDLKNITVTPVLIYKYRDIDTLIIEQIQ